MREDKVKGFRLQGKDGNAYVIIGRFIAAAKLAGWTEDETWEVVEEATKGDYDHLISTFLKVSED